MGAENFEAKAEKPIVILLVLVCDLVGVWCQKYHHVHKTKFSLKSDTYSPDLSTSHEPV